MGICPVSVLHLSSDLQGSLFFFFLDRKAISCLFPHPTFWLIMINFSYNHSRYNSLMLQDTKRISVFRKNILYFARLSVERKKKKTLCRSADIFILLHSWLPTQGHFFHKRSFKNDSVNINWHLSCCCCFLNVWPSNKWASVWGIMHLSCIRSRDICSVEKHPKLKHSRHLWLIFSCVALKQSWWLFLFTKCNSQIHRTAVIIVSGGILSSVFLKAYWSMSFSFHNHECSFFTYST